MSGAVAKKAITIFIFLSLFSNCEELGTLLPSNGSYHVGTLVNGRSLEDCSIIRSDDKIRPYFAVSVVGDPDLIGMLVYLQNSQGEVIGGKVRYILEYYADKLPAETEPQEETSAHNVEENDETKTTNNEAAESPELTENEKWGLDDKETALVSADIIAEIVVKSLDQELPYFPLPKNLEIGPYTLVFEALGKREILSRMDTNIYYLGGVEFNLKDISIYLSGLSGSQLISPGTTVMLEAGLDFDKRLDPYAVWYNGKRIISKGKISEGAGSILWKAPEQAGFYSLRVEILPSLLKRNLTGLIREITLPVSPKAISLGYFFENNSVLTSRSPLAAGTAYPEQVRLIKAIMASVEEEGSDEKEMPVMPLPPELLRWYQFEGNLRDSRSSLPHEQLLAPVTGESPRWAATGQSYGLSVEANDAYQLSPINFFRKEADQGGGIFLLHVRLPAEGTVLSAFFPSLSSSSDGVWMDMVKGKNSVTLCLSNGNAVVELPLYLASHESQGLVPIVIEFYIRPYRLEAKISLSGEYPQNKAGEIKLSDMLTGEGRIKLGAQYQHNAADGNNLAYITTPALASSTEETLLDSADKTFDENSELPATVEFTSEAAPYENSIWDELAILFSSVPLLEEETLAADTAEGPDAAASRETAGNQPEAGNMFINTTGKNPAEPETASGAAVLDNSTSLGLASLKEKIPAPDSSAKSDAAGMINAEPKKAEGDEDIPVADTDIDDSSPENF